MKWLIDWLRDPLVGDMDVDGESRLRAHQEMLGRKRMLREVFQGFHHDFRRLDEQFLSGTGSRIEIGAGVAPMRDSYPDVLATDVVESKQLDRVLNAQDMDLPDASVRAIYAQNCFHHFPDPERFFDELERVLVPGGGAILLEPYYGPLASFLFPRLFRTEGFDKQAPGWQTPVTGPMHGANQALSYLVFIRDRKSFEQKYPGLEIVHQELCSSHWKYLLSGGLNFRQLLPDWMAPVIGFFGALLAPLNRWFSLHHVVVLRKTGG